MATLKDIITSVVMLVITSVAAQNKQSLVFPNGATAAIALTYDDGLPSHIHTVIPILNTYGFKGTFYPTIASPSLHEDMNLWKDAAQQGHELGNHTLYHPCQKSQPGMDWVKEYHDLDHYTLPQLAEEMQVANTMLLALDGQQAHTFAYPCSHYMAGGESYKGIVSQYFTAARDGFENQREPIKIADIDLNSVPSWAPSANPTGDQLIAYAQSIIDHDTFSTLTFHGVGAEYLTTSAQAHQQLLQFLDANRDKIWVATFKEITDYIKAQRTSGN